MPNKLVRETLIEAVLTALKSCPSVPETNVEIAPDSDEIDFPSLSLEDLGDDYVDQDSFSRRVRLRLMVEGFVEGDGGVGVTAALNSLYREVYTALAADQQWGGLAELTEIGSLEVATTPGAHIRQADFSTEITIQFTHRVSDPCAQ